MKTQAFRLSALAAALASAYGIAQAQEQDPAVAELTRPESEVSVGLGYWSKDRPRLGTYDGMREKGAYGLLDAFINSRDDTTGTWFILDGRNLGLDTRELRADWLRQGNMGVSLEYSRTPRDEPYTVRTATQGIGTTTQRTPTPSAAALGEVHLGTVREAFGAGFAKHLGGGYDFRVSVKSEDKTGDRLWGRGGAPEFAAEPIDSNIRQMEAALAYVGKAFQIQGGYYGSWYTNHNSLVDTANMTSAGVLSNQFFLSLPLDNQAHQLFTNGGYNFTERTRATFKVAYTRITQDEQIPVGTGVPVFAGAPTHLDGRIDNTLLQAGLTSRTSDAFSWLANLRYYESDEKTPQVRVIQTAATCGTCVDNTPLHFKTVSGKLEGTYRMMRGVSFVGGVEHAKQDRNVPVGHLNAAGLDAQRYVPFRAELDETTLRLEARRSLSETLNGRIAYLHSKRDGSEFTAAAADAPQANLINPIHIADRERDKVKLMLDWTPLQPLTLTFNVEYAKDDYAHSDERPYGLREGTAAVYSLDAAYSINERWQLTAWYTRDQTEANQVGQRNANGGAAEAVKDAHLEDIGDTFGAGVRGVLMPRLKAGLDFLYSKNVNRYPESLTLTGAGTAYPVAGGVSAVGPLPDITNKLTRVNLHMVYALQKNADLRFDYIYEQWKTDDWSWLFANGTPFTYGTTTDGTQVVQASKQSSNFLGARYVYRFQ
jgi:MtrB/PioB family decaheme-associated outer membrane protein